VAASVLAGLYAAALSLSLEPALEATVVRVLGALAIGAATVVAARLVAGLVGRSAAHRLGTSTSIFVNLSRFVVLAMGTLMVLQTFDISIAPILTALGVGGLAVALALQDTLADLFAGIHILASRKVQPGDFVSLDGGSEGYVEDVGWRNTSIRSLPSNLVLVPNATLARAVVVNFHRPAQEMAVLVEVRVAHGTDLGRVERIAVEVAREVLAGVEGGIEGFDPLVRFHTFGDWSVDCTVVLRAREFTDQYLLKHEFVKRLAARFSTEGIRIPFPEGALRMVGPTSDLPAMGPVGRRAG
jgi:small-conductance mechanosensitive channel